MINNTIILLGNLYRGTEDFFFFTIKSYIPHELVISYTYIILNSRDENEWMTHESSDQILDKKRNQTSEIIK